MLTLVSRIYRWVASAVVAVAVLTLGLYATDLWHLGAASGQTYLADSDAPIVATLPEIEIVAERMQWQ